MCGRYQLSLNLSEISEEASAEPEPGARWAPRYNLAPSQDLLVIVSEEGSRKIRVVKWAFSPSWNRDPGFSMINIRWESLLEKPGFTRMADRSRCLVPANGFYEWKSEAGKKKPMRIYDPAHKLFYFAGILDSSGGFAIVTMAADPFMAAIHHRMPLILSSEEAALWLDRERPFREIAPLIRSAEPREHALKAYAVSTRVNSPKNDVPECVEPDGEEDQRSLGF